MTERQAAVTGKSVRVLVVDDYQPWHAFVSTTLQNARELEIVGNVSDGLEAVQQAQQLQPDLILLDVGLPTLNGIEAARRIRDISPASKIIFVSQENSPDLMREALATGAKGYVVKTDAGSELMIAINVVLRGEQFVSRRLADQQSTDNSKITRCHEVGFYSSDQSFLDHLTQFIGTALKRGDAAIVIATESHRGSLCPTLQAQGLDMTAALEQGRYASFDAGDTLSMCMHHQMPDAVQFSRLIANRIQAAAKAAELERNRVAIFGECVQLLWEQGNGEATIALERIWNQEVLGRHNVEVLCGYSADIFQSRVDNQFIDKIYAEHTAVHSR
jgi:DNA-binding NarL/FixJ family response regulator